MAAFTFDSDQIAKLLTRIEAFLENTEESVERLKQTNAKLAKNTSDPCLDEIRQKLDVLSKTLSNFSEDVVTKNKDMLGKIQQIYNRSHLGE